MSENPLWKRVFDAAERTLAPLAEAFTVSGPFQELVALDIRLRRQVRDGVHDVLRRALHAGNLPAWTDVRTLSQQVARLDQHVRDLEKRAGDGRLQSD